MDTLARFHYTRTGLPQEAGRLTEWQSGRLVQHDDTHYQYDKAGRLIRKQVVQPGYRPQVWQYRWDSRNQLRVVDTPNGTLCWQCTALAQSHPCFYYSIHFLISSTAEVMYINGTITVTIKSG
ncbi:hypothetical protein DZS_18640 [Dickeya ananatis]|nr:hypothetical protein FGI04_03615 [Dickeya zeae]